MHPHNKLSSESETSSKSRWVLATYGVTFLIGVALLYGVDRLDLLTDPLTGLKRAILVAFPASFAATAVDSFSPGNSKENS